SFSLINTLLEEAVVSLYQKLTKMPLTCKQLRERPATCGAASTKHVNRLTTALRADPQFDLGRSCPQRTDYKHRHLGAIPPQVSMLLLTYLLLATRRCWAAALRRYYRWCDASRTSRRIAPLLLLRGGRIRHFAFTDTYSLALPYPMTFSIRR